MTNKIQKNIKIFIGIIIVLVIIFSLSKNYFGNNNFVINSGSASPEASFTAIPSASSENAIVRPVECANPNQRAIAVMMAADRSTRPLSGIGQADMVFEMPVITDSIPRFMAVFRCNFPGEIGSVRSARHDFIDLALAVDAIYAHWGGSHFALDRLKTGIVDDLDALKNPYNVFYRKKGIRAPDNGFTSGELLLNASQKSGYRMENKFIGYPQEPASSSQSLDSNKKGTLKIAYPGEFAVEYRYDVKNNSYLRWRGGKPEIDRINNSQVTSKNIVAMFAGSRQIEGQYNDVNLDGEGKAEFYKDGEKIEGIWRRDATGKDPKLYFLDNAGAEIKFAQGNIWVEVVQTNQKTEWIVNKKIE